uniref:Alpha-(1,6)-fucosyltransferase n=1 Tax=Sipha flava TaxID=143950 RepID=A0A2S2Q8G3_9HEMI
MNNITLVFYSQKSSRNASNAPTKEYEHLRRRIFLNTQEFWYRIYKTFSFQMRKSNDNVKDQISKMINMFREHYTALLRDVSNLAEVDGHSKWRIQESRELSDLVQNDIKQSQNPLNCDNARKLVCRLFKYDCGYSCRLHHVVECLIFAFITKRTLFLNKSNGSFSEREYENLFLPLSDKCRLEDGYKLSICSGNSSARVVYINALKLHNKNSPYLPFEIPVELAPRLNVLHGDPVVWWVGQFLKYIFRPLPNLSYAFEEYKNRVKFQKPIVGVQVRRTDKINREASFHELDEYMYHVEEYYKIEEFNGKVHKKRIYLATDEPSVFYEAKLKYPEYEIIGDPEIPKSASVTDREKDNSIININIDIYFLSLCDYLVCTFSSNICRMAYEIMNSLHPDASLRYTSVDETYNYGHMIRRINSVVIRHDAYGLEEIGIEVGDDVFDYDNLWNGFSRGINLRTNITGIYPTFKVTRKVETSNFSNHPYMQIDQCIFNDTYSTN